MRPGTIASAVGKGLFAGFAGTLAMTAGQAAEMSLRHRQPSAAPAEAAGKALGVTPTGEEEKQRFSQLVHFGYGTGWGAIRGLIGAAGIQGIPAAALHFAAVFGAGLVILPALKVAPPVPEWGTEEIVIDALHHAVYAAATHVAYEALDRD